MFKYLQLLPRPIVLARLVEEKLEEVVGVLSWINATFATTQRQISSVSFAIRALQSQVTVVSVKALIIIAIEDFVKKGRGAALDSLSSYLYLKQCVIISK